MDTLLEERRMIHEQRERIEMAIVDEMLLKKSGHKDQLDSQHRQKRLLDKYRDLSQQLFESYKRQDSLDKVDHDFNQACNKFYVSLKRLTDQLPDFDEAVNVFVGDVEATTTTPIIEVKSTERLVEFTDEEAYGRYLDLNKCHEAFLQVVKHEETKPNYLMFLQNFHQFSSLPQDKKQTLAYKQYIDELLEYFRDFSRRAKPLFDYQAMESKSIENMKQSKSNQSNEPMIDLSSYKSIEQLKELGLECLKKELQARELKCGGTLDERAQRLWSIRGKNPDEIDISIKAIRDTKKGKKKSAIDPEHTFLVETLISSYAEYYVENIRATIENVQRKQARTADERNDSDEANSDVDDDDDDDADDQNDVVYNPKNLPLGWDGKPIPYWLYKLHGLNLTYSCEICGNATYKGPKTFQRHFAEQRHAHGMKCLGIPNTAHFANITKIQDAITLWDKLKNEKQKNSFQPQVEEEYEDSQGNVVNKKTYEDLKRQGLL